MSRIIVRTIPLVGAISLAGCTPMRGGNSRGGGGSNSGDDDDANDPVVGSWELRSYQFGSNEPYEYPTSYSYYGCTTTSRYLLDVLESGGALFTYRTEYDGDCEYSTPYINTSDASWTQLSTALYRIVLGDLGDFTCGLADSELTCDYEGYIYTFRRD